MKKYIVVGNPISHSLSPDLHNHWIKKQNIQAIYEKKQIYEKDIETLVDDIKKEKINGINVTIPFKNLFIPYLDELTLEAEKTKSVNTIFLKKNKIVGHNTDIEGFQKSLKKLNYKVENKKVFILGSGGVVPSIIFALNKMKVSKILLSNRTQSRAVKFKKLFDNLDVVKWGEIPDFDIIINATSVGLNKNDNLNLNFPTPPTNKLFYDVIYNPSETNFLEIGKKYGNITSNGKMMFIYQALAAFKIWHGIEPIINQQVLKIFEK